MLAPSTQPRGSARHAARDGRQWVGSRRPLVFAAVLALVGGVLGYPLVGSPASAAGSRLPGGSSISVTADGPAEGQAIPPGPITAFGTASVGFGSGTPTTALIYAMDLSDGTTDQPAHGGFSRLCNDSEPILNCEKSYITQLQQNAVLANGIAKVGVVGYSDVASAADVGPARGTQLVTGPSTDTDGGGSDAMQAMNSAFSDQSFGDEGGVASGFQRFTSVFASGNNSSKPQLAPAIAEALVDANAAAQPNTFVALISRGVVTDSDAISGALAAVPANVHFYTFVVGKDGSCAGSLQEIADRTGGQCVAPDNPNDGRRLGPLADVLQHLMDAQLDAVSISIDGGSTVPVDHVSQVDNGGGEHFLPLPGPVTAFWHHSLDGLAPGRQHSFCVTAAGHDAGGPGSVSECRTFVIDVPPTVDPGGPYSGLQGAQVPISGTVSDPDSESVTTQWDIRAGAGVKETASCTIGDAAVLATTVSCDAPGTYTLTLTANDGAAPPVTVGTTVTITNVAPVVSAGGPYTGTAELPVQLTGTVTDPDSPELVTTWSVTPPPGSDPGGTATDGTATDGTATDGGSTDGTATDGGSSDGGSTDGTATDGGSTDGGSTTDGTTTDGSTTDGSTTDGGTTTGDVGPPPCVFTDPTALVTEITCPTPGSYTLTLTVNDGDNPPVVATTTLTVVPKTVPVGSLSLAATVGPAVAFVGGDPVLITYTVRNNGVIPMAGITLTTVLPAGLANAVPAPAVLSPAGGAVCRAGAACDLGTLQPGQRRTVQFVLPPRAKIDARVAATLTTTGPDTTAADNKASVRVLIRQPELLVDPTTGPPGLVVHASGHDFPAGAIIKLTWSVGGTQLPGQLIVGRDGTFSAQVLVFNHDQDGPRLLDATTVRGQRFGLVESNSFLVARRGQEPPFDNNSNSNR